MTTTPKSPTSGVPTTGVLEPNTLQDFNAPEIPELPQEEIQYNILQDNGIELRDLKNLRKELTDLAQHIETNRRIVERANHYEITIQQMQHEKELLLEQIRSLQSEITVAQFEVLMEYMRPPQDNKIKIETKIHENYEKIKKLDEALKKEQEEHNKLKADEDFKRAEKILKEYSEQYKLKLKTFEHRLKALTSLEELGEEIVDFIEDHVEFLQYSAALRERVLDHEIRHGAFNSPKARKKFLEKELDRMSGARWYNLTFNFNDATRKLILDFEERLPPAPHASPLNQDSFSTREKIISFLRKATPQQLQNIGSLISTVQEKLGRSEESMDQCDKATIVSGTGSTLPTTTGSDVVTDAIQGFGKLAAAMPILNIIMNSITSAIGLYASYTATSSAHLDPHLGRTSDSAKRYFNLFAGVVGAAAGGFAIAGLITAATLAAPWLATAAAACTIFSYLPYTIQSFTDFWSAKKAYEEILNYDLSKVKRGSPEAVHLSLLLDERMADFHAKGAALAYQLTTQFTCVMTLVAALALAAFIAGSPVGWAAGIGALVFGIVSGAGTFGAWLYGKKQYALVQEAQDKRIHQEKFMERHHLIDHKQQFAQRHVESVLGKELSQELGKVVEMAVLHHEPIVAEPKESSARRILNAARKQLGMEAIPNQEAAGLRQIRSEMMQAIRAKPISGVEGGHASTPSASIQRSFSFSDRSTHSVLSSNEPGSPKSVSPRSETSERGSLTPTSHLSDLEIEGEMDFSHMSDHSSLQGHSPYSDPPSSPTHAESDELSDDESQIESKEIDERVDIEIADVPQIPKQHIDTVPEPEIEPEPEELVPIFHDDEPEPTLVPVLSPIQDPKPKSAKDIAIRENVEANVQPQTPKTVFFSKPPNGTLTPPKKGILTTASDDEGPRRPKAY